MRALVVYESMYGNTHIVAVSIAAGLDVRHKVTVVPLARATQDLVAASDLLVVGGPTHMHGMANFTSRWMAANTAAKRAGALVMDPDALGPGIPGWMSRIGAWHGVAAAFDTRTRGLTLLTGRASRDIATLLEVHGYRLLAAPESFFVSRHDILLEGEAARATAWGAVIGEVARSGALPVSPQVGHAIPLALLCQQLIGRVDHRRVAVGANAHGAA